MTIRAFLLALMLALLWVACQPETRSVPPAPESTASPDSSQPLATPAVPTTDTRASTEPDTTGDPPARENRIQTPPPRTLEPIPTLEEQMPITGEVPQDLLQQMVDDLSQRIDVPSESITVERAEEVVWRDGSLGCPQPGMVYTQALVPGYRVTLVTAEQHYHYHANDSGYFFLCENPSPPGEGPPTGSSDR